MTEVRCNKFQSKPKTIPRSNLNPRKANSTLSFETMFRYTCIWKLGTYIVYTRIPKIHKAVKLEKVISLVTET